MAEADSKKDPKKLMDVSKPGKTAPSTTAKPVIVGHKPLLQQDPMVNPSGAEDKEEINTEASHAAKVIEPPTEAEQAPQTDEAEQTEAVETPTEPEKTEEQTPALEPAKETEPAEDNSAVVDAVAEQANAKKKTDELSQEEKKKQEAVAKLIEEKTYFVPIKIASRKRNARATIFILIVLLLLVGVYLAADAGIISLPFKLPIHIIPN